jgi:hypothetical protein
MALTASSVFYPASFAACPHSHRIAMADTVHELQRFYVAANYGTIEKLTQQNYFSWKQSMMVYLRSLLLLDIVEGTRGPIPANASRERHEQLAKDTYKEMWTKLQKQFDAAASYSSREKIYADLTTAMLKKGELISDFIARMTVLHYRLAGTPQAVDASSER